jgi:hypothetical protein
MSLESADGGRQLALELLAVLQRVRAVVELGVRVGDIRAVLWATQDETLRDYIDSAIANGHESLREQAKRIGFEDWRGDVSHG